MLRLSEDSVHLRQSKSLSHQHIFRTLYQCSIGKTKYYFLHCTFHSLAKIYDNSLQFKDMNIDKLKIDLQEIYSKAELPVYIQEIISKITEGKITIDEVETICFNFNVNYSMAKVDFLHLIFEYIRIALQDDILSFEEKEIIGYFKRIFKISPGDFIFHTREKVENVINYQLERIYNDNYITPEEALIKIDLQELFDLSFDQMNDYSKIEAITSLKEGADVGDLDVFFTHKEYFDLKSEL